MYKEEVVVLNKQWNALEAVIQLLDADYISEGCFLGAELDCPSCQAILVRTILRDMQRDYREWEEVGI